MDESILPPPYAPKKNAEELARRLFEGIRWPPNGKPTCPDCGSQWPIYQQTRKGVAGYYRCPALHPHPSGSPKPLVFTVRSGTLLERSHLPLDKWLYCLSWYGRLPAQHTPPSANRLAKLLGINRKTASSVLKHMYELRFGDDSEDQDNEFLLILMATMVKAHNVAVLTNQA